MKKKPLIVALDTETDKEALQFVKTLAPSVDIFKVGPVLFLKYGGPFLRQIKDLGAEIFLDLKFHDIPSVVKKAVERAGEWGVFSATLHLSGGPEMLKQAVSVSKRPQLWGVTVLTSLDQSDLQATGVTRPLKEQVTALARLGADCGLNGVISSAQDVKDIKRACGTGFTVVTPGIRLESAGDDQKRAQTPAQAIQNGADFIVVGRPILEAKDPEQTVKAIYKSITPTSPPHVVSGGPEISR